MSDDKKDEAKAKKGGPKKLIMIGLGGLLLVGGGVGAGLYAAGMVGAEHAVSNKPRLVPASEQKHAGDGEEGGHGGGEDGDGAAEGHEGKPTPSGEGGDDYASNYYSLDREFTSNLLDSVHFVQVGLAVSTPYDDTVISNLKTHEIAVRSAVLMALGETSEDQVFSMDGKQQLQKRLVKAINGVLKQKTGFGGIGNVYFTTFVVQ